MLFVIFSISVRTKTKLLIANKAQTKSITVFIAALQTSGRRNFEENKEDIKNE